MLELRVRALLVIAALAGCLPTFATPIRARGAHVGARKASPDAECLACHPVDAHANGTARAHPRIVEPAVATVRDRPPAIVPTWMVEDTRGCVGCHAVWSARTP